MPKSTSLGESIATLLRIAPSAGSVLAYAVGTVACQYVAGLEDRRVEPPGPPVDAGLSDAVLEASDSEPVESDGCTLPSVGASQLRFGNLAMTDDRIHLCVIPVGADEALLEPLTMGDGKDCPDGLGYRDVLIPVALSDGTYQLKAVDRGAQDCAAPALARVETTIAAHTSKTVLLMGGGAAPFELRSFDETPITSLTTLIRFINASSGLDPLDAGLVADLTTAWKIGMPVFEAVPFGAVAEPTTTPVGAIDGNGYLDMFVASADLTFAVARAGTDEALSYISRPFASANAYSLFAVGSESTPDYPLQVLACSDSESDRWFTKCWKTAPVDVTFTALSVKLDGAFAPAPLQRQPYVPPAIASADTDVLCITDDYMPEHRAAIRDAAKLRFPYAYWVDTDSMTPIDDPRDVTGKVPEPPTTPACTGAETVDKATALLDCAVDRCADVPGDPSTPISDGPCVVSNCALQLFGMVGGSDSDRRCFGCLLYGMIGYEPRNTSEVACRTDPFAGRPFGGQNGEMLLSRFPIRDVAHVVLPSAVWRVVALRASLELPNGTDLDVYCSNFDTATRNEGTQPYYGPYGEGPSESHWTNESLLQAQRLLEWIALTSGPSPSVVLGEFDSGPGASHGSEPIAGHERAGKGESGDGEPHPSPDLREGAAGCGTSIMLTRPCSRSGWRGSPWAASASSATRGPRPTRRW